MREIKFMGYDTEANKSFGPIIIFGPDSDLCGQADKAFYNSWDYNVEFKHLIWRQYTGLHDKNGKEIYEGDIVKSKHRVIDNFKVSWEEYIGVVKYSTCVEARYIIDLDGDSFIRLHLDDGEVIGNIHENPELLKS